jgi:hypothetical protein
MRRLLRMGFACALLVLAGAQPPRVQAADPLVMFLLGIARDIVLSHAARDAPRAPGPAVEPGPTYPGTTVEPGQMKRLIDECFTYLSEAQRAEVFDALNAALLDPKNAAVRAPMIEYFVEHALAVRAARERLARLSTREKELLAAEFRAEVAAMPAEEQSRLGEALRKGLLPVPDDLGQMLLAALGR